MKFKITIFCCLFMFTIVSCQNDMPEYADDSYSAVFKDNNFGNLIGQPSPFEFKKKIILGETPKYGGGASFASVCKKNENNYLIVATGYGKYDDFGFSELVNLDIDITTKETAEMSVFQENLGKIQTGGNSLLKISDKTILSFFFSKESTKLIDVYMKTSLDNGLTWSAPRVINTIKNAYQHCANNRAILLSSGRIVLPMAIGGTGSSNYVFCYYSDDNGDTWQNTKLFNTGGNELYEPCVAELEKGKLIMTLRNSSGKILFAFSNDDGLYWTDFVKSNLNCPDAPSTIAKVPNKNILVLIWNNNSNIFDYQNRSPLSLATSKDEGKTWTYLFDIENRTSIGAYYPTINFTEDKMLITYTQKISGDSKSNVVFTEFLLSIL